MTVSRLEPSTPKELRRMTKSQLLTEVAWREDNLDLFQERLAELELAIEDIGWMKLSFQHDTEFSPWALARLIEFARYMYLKNPLINHAIEVQADYIWAQGATIAAEDEVVNEVMQKHMDDYRNNRVVYGHMARSGLERQAQTEGNIFLALFTNRANGWVRVRTIPTIEILNGDIISNPEDREDTWFYKRRWTQRVWDRIMGRFEHKEFVEYYPDWKHRPQMRDRVIDGKQVNWDIPIYHVKTGSLPGMRFGIPEVYAALDWAKAVTEDLQDYATVKRALTRFAWNMKVPGGKQGVQSARNRLTTTLGQGSYTESNPPPVTASTFVRAEGVDMQPIKTSGAQASPDEGRRLWLMTAAGVGIPETMLSGDAEVGNLATSKTLDRPTELKMVNRQAMWAGIFQDLLNYVVDAAVRAPNGLLPGLVIRDPISGEEVITLAGELDRTVTMTFPPILERDAAVRVGAVIDAATLKGQTLAHTLPDKTLVRLLLDALDVEEADEVIESLFPDGATDLPVPEPPLGAVPPPGTVPGDDAGVTPQLFEALRKFVETARAMRE